MLDKIRCVACSSKDLTFKLIRGTRRVLRSLKAHPNRNLSVTCNACGVNVNTSVKIKKDEHLLQLDELYEEIHIEQ